MTRPRSVASLHVRRREILADNLVRIVAGGPGYAEFVDNDYTDKYVKILFTDADGHPARRTYTVRRADADAQQLTLDFVTHGDVGLAAPWAGRAEVGESITLSGAGGRYRPDDADWHVFAGDESAEPAISAALEALPATARGAVFLETRERFLDAVAPRGVQVHWLDRPEPGTRPELLAAALREQPWPDGRVSVFAHGERESMKAVRAVMKERAIPREQVSLSGYWAYGRTEDVFQAEKREPIGQLD